MQQGKGRGERGNGTTPGNICQELSRHKNQSADWYLFHGFLTSDFPVLGLRKQAKRSSALLTPQFNYGGFNIMTFVDICKAYGEVHDMNTVEVINQYNKGLITQYELFEAFLENEGIYGYTQKIISAFRCVYEVE